MNKSHSVPGARPSNKSCREERLMHALCLAAKNALAICLLLDKSLFKSLFGNIRERPSHGRQIPLPVTGYYLPWERRHHAFTSPSKERLTAAGWLRGPGTATSPSRACAEPTASSAGGTCVTFSASTSLPRLRLRWDPGAFCLSGIPSWEATK